MTAPDLDALEKLAESFATLDSEERDWPLVKIHGRMFHVENAAKAASDGLTALIAELKEARRLLEEVQPLSICWATHYASGRGFEQHPQHKALNASIRAFLARNGKGEGQ